jgi:D-galactarolactone cycloisomerase
MPTSHFHRRRFLQAGVPAALAAGAAFSHLAPLSAADEPEKPSGLKITEVETFLVRSKLPKAVGVSIALSDTRSVVLVKITTDSGLVGWGETGDIAGARAVIETKIKPVLLGRNPLEIRKLRPLVWGRNFVDGRAVGAVDVALDDLRGKALGRPVSDLYGGRVRDKVLAYASAMNYTDGVDPEDQFPEEAAGLVKQGYRALKMRTGRYGVRRDLAVITKIREAAGPDVRLLTDGNGSYTLSEAVKFGKELEKLDFYCWEEPLPQGLNYAGYDVLTESLDIAVAGGEALDSRITARDHIVRRSFDIIQPDVNLCGGIGEVLFIAEMAKLWSIPCLPHCWAGAIGTAASLQLLALLPDTSTSIGTDEPMLEMDTIPNPFRDEFVAEPFKIDAEGKVAIPKGPGLGIEIDEEVVKKYLA